jgi:hypothetical protein
MDLIRYSEQIAKKSYHCDACRFIFEDYREEYYTSDELLVLEGIKSDKQKVLAGQRYIKQIISDCGDFYVFRARIDAHNLCLKYDMYRD